MVVPTIKLRSSLPFPAGLGPPGPWSRAMFHADQGLTLNPAKCNLPSHTVLIQPVSTAKAQKIEMDKLEKAKKERTKVSDE